MRGSTVQHWITTEIRAIIEARDASRAQIMAQKEIMIFFSDNENFERGPPRHAGGNGNQGINFVWPYH